MTRCGRGHPRNAKNTRIVGNRHVCRACERLSHERSAERRAAGLIATAPCQECEAAAVARGLCAKHYKRRQRYGHTALTRTGTGLSIGATLAQRTERAGIHLLWVGPRLRSGTPYMTTAGRKTRPVRRVAWETYVGPVPEGLVVTVNCGEMDCVDVAHLHLVRNGSWLEGSGRWGT